MVFLRKYNVFQKSPKCSRGGSRGVLREFLGPLGGPGTPPGGRAVFQGGPRGPFGGPWEFRGGGQGGPEAPVITSAGYSWFFPSPKGLQETCLNQWENMVFKHEVPDNDQPAFLRTCKRAPRDPWETEGNQRGSKEAPGGGPRGARGRPRGPKGGPRGDPGGPRVGPGTHAHL